LIFILYFKETVGIGICIRLGGTRIRLDTLEDENFGGRYERNGMEWLWNERKYID
jgi:hypothetical protein